jgi:hypothetical protein
MSSVISERQRGSLREEEDLRGGYSRPVERQESGSVPWGLIIGGLVIGGMAAMAWNYFGPDLRRYIKMSNM